MNRTATIAPIIGALVKAEDILGADRPWVPVNDQQRELIQRYFSKRSELSRFSPKELRSWVDFVAETLNEILRREGFTIQLDKFSSDEFGVVSILDVLVEWAVEGMTTIIKTKASESFPAVKLTNKKDDEPAFSVRKSREHVHPIAVINAKSDDVVCMTLADGPESDFQLLERIRRIESCSQSAEGYVELRFPMVSLDETVDIGWLRQLETTDVNGQQWGISQALQQTKFKMNQQGARAKSAVAVAVMRGIRMGPPPLHLVIDAPFFLWINRPGMSIPIFAAYLDESVWKNPGNLDL